MQSKPSEDNIVFLFFKGIVLTINVYTIFETIRRAIINIVYQRQSIQCFNITAKNRHHSHNKKLIVSSLCRKQLLERENPLLELPLVVLPYPSLSKNINIVSRTGKSTTTMFMSLHFKGRELHGLKNLFGSYIMIAF